MDSHIVVTGNVGTDIDWREGEGYDGRALFRLACTPRYEAGGEYFDGPTTWYRVACYRRLAARVRECVRKGDPVVVGGKLTTRRWTDADGVEHELIELSADWVGHDLRFGQSTFARTRRDTATAPERTAPERTAPERTAPAAPGSDAEARSREVRGKSAPPAEKAA